MLLVCVGLLVLHDLKLLSHLLHLRLLRHFVVEELVKLVFVFDYPLYVMLNLALRHCQQHLLLLFEV